MAASLSRPLVPIPAGDSVVPPAEGGASAAAAVDPDTAGNPGILPSQLSAADRRELESVLHGRCMTVDLGHPGLRVLHLDPPIFTVGITTH